MSSRLAQALSVGSVIVVNRETTSVSVTIPVDGQRIVRQIKTGVETNLTRLYTVKQLKASNLRSIVNRRRIEIVDTWTHPAEQSPPAAKGS